MTDWKWLLKQIRPMSGWLLLAVLLCLLDMLSLLGITAVQKWLIDDVFMEGQYDKLTFYLVIFAALIFGYNGVHLVSFMLNRANEFRLQRKLTVQLMGFMYRMKAGKYHSERIGSISQRFTGDIQAVSWLAARHIPDGLTRIAQVLVLAVFVGLAHPLLLLLICLPSLVLIAAGKRFGPKLKSAGKDVQETKAELLVHIEEGVSSTREVIAFHQLEWEMKKYRRSFARFFDKVMHEGKLHNRQLAWSEPFRWGMNLAVLACGALLAISGEMSVGTFVVVYQFSAQLLDGIHSVYGIVMGFPSRAGSIERVRDFMEGTEPDGGAHLDEAVREIRFQDITFRYSDDSTIVLDGLTLDIPIGKKVAFVGSSGGGKSTIAQLLERFYEPLAGHIFVNGKPLHDISLSEWRTRVNLVPQEPYLFPDTIRNNLLMGRDGITEETMIAACRAAEIDEDIAGLPDGYDTVLGERGITLSGGQRQRLAIARSLLADPEILILDEATSALDIETERRVQRKLDALREDKTTIIIAHRLSTVENADMIYVMDRGRLAEQGTHEELLQSGERYRNLVYAKAVNT